MRVKDMEVGQELKCSKCGVMAVLTAGMKKIQTRICEDCHINRSLMWWSNNREKVRQFQNKSRINKPVQYQARQKRYRANNTEKWKARNKVRYAIDTGQLIRKPCEVCGDLKSHGHHDDYSKPLDVIWLCTQQHFERHESIRRK